MLYPDENALTSTYAVAKVARPRHGLSLGLPKSRVLKLFGVER